MKHKLLFVPLFIVFSFISQLSMAFPEGSKELNTNGALSTSLYLCNDFANHCNSANGVRSQFATFNATQSAADNDRLYFTVANSSEIVYMGFNGGNLGGSPARHIVYQIREKITGTLVKAEADLPTTGVGYINTLAQAQLGPNALILPPNPQNGYDAVTFTPPSPGTYYIEFSVRRNDNLQIYVGTFSIDIIDITVGNTTTMTAKPGRLYSKAWQFTESNRFYCTNYIISDDSIVTSAAFSNMQGGAWVQYCNQTGCGTTNWMIDRKSLYHLQALYPQYKIFLNNPDPVLFPSATTLGQIVNPAPWGERFCNNGHIIFHINVNKPGNVELQMNFNMGYAPRTMNQPVVVGENLFDWDGLDGTTPVGLPVANGTTISFTIKYINGLTNLPLYDVEGNQNGFTIALVAPAGTTPAVFWDDTNIPGGTNNSSLPGCISPPACHSWSGTGSGWGNLNTVNTWWYNVSTTTVPAIITEFRNPQALTFIQSPPYVFCENTSGHVFTVNPDPSTDVYHWSYTPPAGVTITQSTPASNTISISFGPGATSGTLSVYGTNTNCASMGPTTTIPITINPLPLPVITGPASACVGASGNTYNTQAGKTNYSWTVTSGGSITSGGGSSDNYATITWNTAGSQSVSVNYTDNGCTSSNATTYTVTVNSLPVPPLSGNVAPCLGTPGNVYTTTAGKLNYVWNVSSGGTITSGGTSTSNSVTITWNSAGPQMVSVNYTEPGTGCTATSPTLYNVNVQTLAIATISGPNDVCAGQTGNAYTTESGGTNYLWTVTAGGTVTSGGTSSDNSVTVTWNTPGAQVITVFYTNSATGCVVAAPATYNINVKPLPVPSLTGPVSACLNTSGPVYTTDPGMNGYLWTIVPGSAGIITSGSSTNAVNVIWTQTGNQVIFVNYTNSTTGCTANTPSSLPVTVNPLPNPTISGANNICTGIPTTYNTEAGHSNYIWVVSSGGTIVSGGTAADASVIVNWTTQGAQTVSVNYTIATGCTAGTPSIYNVTVNEPTVPVLTSPVNPICVTHSTTYTTQGGMTGYTWIVSSGGTITSGGTPSDNTVTVLWNAAGAKYVEVNFTNGFGCTPTTATRYDLTVLPLPVPALTGPNSACVNNPGPVYATDPGMNTYSWSIVPPAAGNITGGSGTNSVNITWLQTGIHNVSVNYISNITGCTANSPTSLQVTVNTLPTPTINGAAAICTGIPTTYTTQSGVSNYGWNISSGGTVISGGTSSDPSVTVNWITPGAQSVSVNYTIGTGCTALSPTIFPVTVNQSTPPVLSGLTTICETNSATYSTQVGMSGYSWSISPGGTFTSPVTGNSVTVLWNTAGTRYLDVNFTNGFGCIAPTPTRLNVTVNPLPVTTITQAPGPACQSAPQQYMVPVDPASAFTWSVLPALNGTITAGQGTNAITINWTNYGNATVAVTGTNNATGCYSSSTFPVNVHPAPAPSFSACFDLTTTPNARKFNLRGGSPYLPVQGVYSGNRVSYNSGTGCYEFDPYGASPGSYPVLYSFTNNYGCINATQAITITVTSASFNCGGDLTDVRDGKKYKTSFIGGKCWMKENLNYGTILNPSSVPQTDNCVNEKYCLSSDVNCSAYGGLYQWDELLAYASTSANQGLCPPEWHIPTEAEWQLMINAISISIPPPADGIAGSFMKDAILNPGFQALTGGIFYLNNNWAFTSGSLTGTMYWTSSQNGTDRCYARGVNSINPSVSKYPGSRENAFSVRCVKD